MDASKSRHLALLGAPLLLLAACASTSHVMIGKARPPVPVSQVTVYMEPPANYERIALIDASSQGSMRFGEQAKSDIAIQRLRQEAARLGANGVLFEGMGDQPGAVIGTGGSNVSFGGNSSVGVGFGLSNQLTYKLAHGVAIYVTAAPPAAP